jgi:hypothetical protein
VTDSTKTILYPRAALLALVMGTLLFGWWCGLTAVWSARFSVSWSDWQSWWPSRRSFTMS